MSDLLRPGAALAMPADGAYGLAPSAGRELDALVAEKVMGISLVPPREYAMAKVATKYVVSTGNPFHVRIGDKVRDVRVPDGHTLRQPEGSDYWNDRYFLYIAEYLDKDIAAEVDAYRLPPKPYSTDIAAAWLVVEHMKEARGMSCVVANNSCARSQNGVKFFEGFRGLGHSIFDASEHKGWDAVAETVPLAICRAALAAVKGAA